MKRLFKDITVLMLASLVAGCQQREILTDIIGQEEEERQAIGFVGGYIDSQVSTRANMTSLSDHMNTMGVWAWETYKSEPEQILFNNQDVTYNPSTGKWEYSPVKYWNKNTTYRFYAYAPYKDQVTTANVTFDDESHFGITGITLKGDNVMYPTAQREALNNFSSVDDVDWLIDRTGQCGTQAELGKMVTFNMQHLLAKLTVKMRTNYSGQSFMKLDSMRVGDFVGGADFHQQLNHNPSSENSTDMTAHEWTIDTNAPLYKIESARDTDIDQDGMYVLESLIIPQKVTASQYVDVYYSAEYEAGSIERFHYRFSMDKVFTEFLGGNNYTLTLTVASNVITFDSGVSEWKDEVSAITNM